jgi:hypothetical protein
MPHEAESFKNRQNSFSGGPNRAKIPRNKPRTASSWNSDAPKGVVQAFHKLLIYLVLSDSIKILLFCSAFIDQTIHFSIKVLGKDIEALIFILLGLALPMIGVSGSDELDDEQTDLGIEPPSNGPGEIEKLIDTWRPDDLSGRGNGDDYPMRIEGRNGSDTRHGHDGDQLVGGAAADVFTVVVGEADAAPVLIEDLKFIPIDDQTNPDRILFTTADGTPVPFRGVLEGGIEVVDAEDGSGASISYEGKMVAKVANATADELNGQSNWIGNFSNIGGSGFGDDYLVGDQYQNPDDHLDGGDGNDTLIGGNGTDLLHGENGNDFIDATDPAQPSDNFDLVIGGEGHDTMRGDDGDHLYGTVGGEGHDTIHGDDVFSLNDTSDHEDSVVVDIVGHDQFEVLLSDHPDADPVVIVGHSFGNGTNLGESLFLLHPDGNVVSQQELDENLVVETRIEGVAHSLIYNGVNVAVVFDAVWLFDQFGVSSAQNSAAAAVLAQQLGLSDALEVINIALKSAEGTGHFVSDALFGGNIVYAANTDQGDPVENFKSALDILEIDHVRFPGGQGDHRFQEGDGEEWLNVVIMEPNESGELDLRPELKTLLDWARDPDGDGDLADAKSVTLVLPTHAYSLEQYIAFAPEIEKFAAKLIFDYGDVVEALEIGNEYWAMGETVYATKANIAIDSLLKGFASAGVEEADQPDILVQMATPNVGSEFNSAVDGRGFLIRNRDANLQIINNLSDQSKTAIDGVVEHYYFNDKDHIFDHDSSEVNFINTDLEVWKEALNKDLKLSITEWNIKNSNLEQNGLIYTGAFAEEVSRLVQLDVNLAHIWAVQHNTATDLAGDRNHQPFTNEAGHLISTVRGAMFDITNDILPGAELLELTFEGYDGRMEIHGYQTEDRVVFQISSRVVDEVHLITDFSEIVPEFASVQTVKVSMDTSSSDGIHYQRGVGMVEAPYAIIDGQRFYYGEHDVRAVVEEGQCTSNVFDRTYKPFETYQVIYYLNPDTVPAALAKPLQGVSFESA